MRRLGMLPPSSAFTGDQYRSLRDWHNRLITEQNVPYLRRLTSSSTLSVDDDLLLCQSASTMTVTLLPASTVTFRIFSFHQRGTGNVILDGNASELINGSVTTATGSQYRTITLQSTGTEWVSR